MSQPGEPYDPNAGHEAVPTYPQYPPSGPYPAPYPQYGPPPGAPGYPAYQAYQGYPTYPAYPGYPSPYILRRPGNATAANVLAYVTAGLLIAAGLLLFLGASIIDGFDDLDNNSHSLVTAELVLDGILNFVAGGLLIAGGVSFGNRSSSGRILLSVGSGIVIGESVYWIFRSSGAAIFWALLFAAMVIISLSLAWTSTATAWLRAGT